MSFLKQHYQKLIITIVLLSLAFFSVSKLFDNYGEKYTEEGFQRSLVAFAIAKTLNGAISIVQGTEVALEPAGIGVILAPGQILDPVNDLIERFSWVMLLCTTSLGIQSIVLTIFSSLYFSIVVSASLLLVAFTLWRSHPVSARMKNISYRIVAFLVILRFCIPVMAVASEGIYKGFLEPIYTASRQHLESSGQVISNISQESMEVSEDSEDYSWYESLTKNINSAIDTFDVNKRVEQLKNEAESITKNVIDLIIVFTLQTILFPLLFLWLTAKLIKSNFTFKYV